MFIHHNEKIVKKMNRGTYEASKLYFSKENCPFCSQSIAQNNEIYTETKFWIIIFNKYPYFDESGIHLLAIPKRHIEFTSELRADEMTDFIEVEKHIQVFYKNKASEYFSFIRQSKGNKSVEHFHYHYLPGTISAKRIDGEKYLKIQTKKKNL